jgi:hypothetical protein
MPKERDSVSPKDLRQPRGKKVSQLAFARFLGVDRSVICRLVDEGILGPNGNVRDWWLQYLSYLKGVAAGVRGRGF